MALDKNELRNEWDHRKKDWYSIYQWERTDGAAYTEWIAEWIAESFETIKLNADGLRKGNFKVHDHSGQADLKAGVEERYEQCVCRAIYNLREMPILGTILDCEVHLKATEKAKHGKIDLLCRASEALLFVEAKQPRSTESILKAILQAFTYTSLVAIRRDAFLAEFELLQNLLLTPAILTFADAKSGRQLRKSWYMYPHLDSLVRMLNTKLAKSGAGEIRFFIIDNDKSEVNSCLVTEAQSNGYQKVIFTNGFTPNVSEWGLFSANGQEAIIRIGSTNGVGNNIVFDLYARQNRKFTGKFCAHAEANIAAHLHQGNFYSVRFNNDAHYPRIERVIQEVPKENS